MYTDPRNNPAIPNESKQHNFDRRAENPPKQEQQPTLNLQYYQPKPAPKTGLNPAQFNPVYVEGIAYPPQLLYGHGYPQMNLHCQ